MKAGPNGAANVASDGAAEAAGTASADRVVGRTPICRRPTTPSPGSRDGYRRAGSPTVDVSADREEIVVFGTLTGEAADAAQAEGRISRFREETRETRIQIAEEAQTRYGRKVSWGARSGEVGELFTHLSVPVMTRLRQPERQVLDTLVDAGVARSRSEALAWAVTLVGEHTETWLSGLRDAMSEVDKLRSQGPEL